MIYFNLYFMKTTKKLNQTSRLDDFKINEVFGYGWVIYVYTPHQTDDHFLISN